MGYFEKLDPNCSGAHYTLGVIYSDLNLNDKAVNELQTFIKLMPNVAEAHFFLGREYYRTGQIEDARKETIAGLKLAPDNKQGQQLMCEISASHRKQ